MISYHQILITSFCNSSTRMMGALLVAIFGLLFATLI